jgi:hypothetical protein
MGLGTAAAALVSSSSAQTGRVPSPSNLEQALPSSLPGTVRPFSASSVGKINPGLCFIGHFGPRIKKKIQYQTAQSGKSTVFAIQTQAERVKSLQISAGSGIRTVTER